MTLCSYPFIFDAQAKTKMLQTDAELQMQVILLSQFSCPISFSLPPALVPARKGIHWELVCAALHFRRAEQLENLFALDTAEAVLGVFHCKMFGNVRTAGCACGGNLNCTVREYLCFCDSPRITSKVRSVLEEL